MKKCLLFFVLLIAVCLVYNSYNEPIVRHKSKQPRKPIIINEDDVRKVAIRFMIFTNVGTNNYNMEKPLKVSWTELKGKKWIFEWPSKQSEGRMVRVIVDEFGENLVCEKYIGKNWGYVYRGDLFGITTNIFTEGN